MNLHLNIVTFVLIILHCNNVNAQEGNCFTIGSSKLEVKKAQGTPTSISSISQYETWRYEFSTITFENGAVKGFDNRSKNLKICKEFIKKEKETHPHSRVNEHNNKLSTIRVSSTASRSETENWILGKLNGYIGGKIINSYPSPNSPNERKFINYIYSPTFRIESGNLVVSFESEYINSKHKEMYVIPINDLDSLCNRDMKLILKTKNKTIKHYMSSVLKDNLNNFSIPFDFYSEERLYLRMVESFAHLLKFYKSSPRAETF